MALNLQPPTTRFFFFVLVALGSRTVCSYTEFLVINPSDINTEISVSSFTEAFTNKRFPDKVVPLSTTGFRIVGTCAGCTAYVTSGGLGGNFFNATLVVPAWSSPIIVYVGINGNMATVFTGEFSSEQDSLLHMETYVKTPVPNTVLLLTIRYPKGGADRSEIITWMNINDSMSNDKRSIRVTKGGVGFNFAVIEMRSKAGLGLNMMVQVYGRNYTTENWPFVVNGGNLTQLVFNYWPYTTAVAVKPPVRECKCRSGMQLQSSDITVFG